MNAANLTLRILTEEVIVHEGNLLSTLNPVEPSLDPIRRTVRHSLTRLSEWLQQSDSPLPEAKQATAEAAALVSGLAQAALRSRAPSLDRELRQLALSLIYLDVCQLRAEADGRQGAEAEALRRETGRASLLLDEARWAMTASRSRRLTNIGRSCAAERPRSAPVDPSRPRHPRC